MYERPGGKAGMSLGSPSDPSPMRAGSSSSSRIESSSARSRPAGSLAGRLERTRRADPSAASPGRGQASAAPAATTGGLSWDGNPEEGEAVASPVRGEFSAEPARPEPPPDSTSSGTASSVEDSPRRSTPTEVGCEPKRALRSLRAEGGSEGRTIPPGRGSSSIPDLPSSTGAYSGEAATSSRAPWSTSIDRGSSGAGAGAGAERGGPGG